MIIGPPPDKTTLEYAVCAEINKLGASKVLAVFDTLVAAEKELEAQEAYEVVRKQEAHNKGYPFYAKRHYLQARTVVSKYSAWVTVE